MPGSAQTELIEVIIAVVLDVVETEAMSRAVVCTERPMCVVVLFFAIVGYGMLVVVHESELGIELVPNRVVKRVNIRPE